MKKMISVIAVAAAASAAFADSTVFGVLRVDSTNSQTIVAVPWVSASAAGSAISVADVVKTDNLAAGDRICAYRNGVYEAWRLVNNGGTLEWQSANNVTVLGTTLSEGAAARTLERGDALLLIRDDPGPYFYLNGQVPSGAAGTVTLPAGAWSLVAPPSTADFNLNTAVWTGPGSTDEIIFKDANANMITLMYKDGAWKGKVKNPSTHVWEWSASAAVVPAGTGAWYHNKGESAVTVNFGM